MYRYDAYCPKCKSKEINIPAEDYLEKTKDSQRIIVCCKLCGQVFRIMRRESDSGLSYDNFIGDVKKEDIIKDVPGQKFLWEDLYPSGVKLY